MTTESFYVYLDERKIDKKQRVSFVEAVGTSAHSTENKKFFKAARKNKQNIGLACAYEPDNRYDPKAIAVISTANGKFQSVLGYVPRTISQKIYNLEENERSSLRVRFYEIKKWEAEGECGYPNEDEECEDSEDEDSVENIERDRHHFHKEEYYIKGFIFKSELEEEDGPFSQRIHTISGKRVSFSISSIIKKIFLIFILLNVFSFILSIIVEEPKQTPEKNAPTKTVEIKDPIKTPIAPAEPSKGLAPSAQQQIDTKQEQPEKVKVDSQQSTKEPLQKENSIEEKNRKKYEQMKLGDRFDHLEINGKTFNSVEVLKNENRVLKIKHADGIDFIGY